MALYFEKKRTLSDGFFGDFAYWDYITLILKVMLFFYKIVDVVNLCNFGLLPCQIS